MGYVKLNVPGQGICVSYYNAPHRTWRGALAYLLERQEHTFKSSIPAHKLSDAGREYTRPHGRKEFAA